MYRYSIASIHLYVVDFNVETLMELTTAKYCVRLYQDIEVGSLSLEVEHEKNVACLFQDEVKDSQRL